MFKNLHVIMNTINTYISFLLFFKEEYEKQLRICNLCVYIYIRIVSHVQLCDPVDYSLPGSSLHGILQARVLEWVAISFSKKNAKGELNYLFPSLELSFCGRCYDIGLYFIESK